MIPNAAIRVSAVLICCSPLIVFGQTAPGMSDDQVSAAIEAAKQTMPPAPYILKSRWEPITADPSGKPLDPKLARAINANAPPPTVYGALFTPFVRVAMLARKAAESYKPFTTADVPADMKEQLVYVLVRPFEKRSTGLDRFVDAQHVVILPTGSRDAAQAIQPVWVRADTTVLQNAFGAKIETRGIVAAFPPDAIQPDRDLVFIYAGPIMDGPQFANITQQRLAIRAEDKQHWR
jgi:hypothetical protein